MSGSSAVILPAFRPAGRKASLRHLSVGPGVDTRLDGSPDLHRRHLLSLPFRTSTIHPLGRRAIAQSVQGLPPDLTDVLIRIAVTSFGAGRPSPLPELPIQYADFAIWQRRWLAGEALEAALDYWRSRLEGVRRLRLAADRQRPAKRTADPPAGSLGWFRGADHSKRTRRSVRARLDRALEL